MASYKDYEEIFDKASATYGVDKKLLIAVAKTESNFNPKATSSAGAKGIMQLMDGTAKGLGVTNSYDPEQNIMGGAKYLSQLLDKYDGDVTKSLAAYNGGPGNVAKYGASKYSNYYNKVYSNMESLSDVEGVKVTNTSFQQTGILSDKKDEIISSIVVVVFTILVGIAGVVFMALSVGSATGTTSKMTGALKTVAKAKSGDLKGALDTAQEVAGNE